MSLNALGLVKLAGLENLALLVTPLNLRGQSREVTTELWGHRSARCRRLISGVVVSNDRNRGVRHECVVDVVDRIDLLAVAWLPLVFNPGSNSSVPGRDCRCTEASTIVVLLEDRSVETGVAVLNHTILVLHPHEHVVLVEGIFVGLICIRQLTEPQRVVPVRIGLAVDGLEDVLRVILEHLLGRIRQLVRVVLELLVQFLVCCGAVLGQRRCVHRVTVSGFVDGVHRRASCHNALIRATSFKPNTAGKHVGFIQLRSRCVDRTLRILNELVTLGCHPAGFVVRRNLLVERGRQLDVAIRSGERTKGTFNETIEGTRDEAVCLTEHYDLVSTVVGVRLNPDAVLLIRTSSPCVLNVQLVGPGNALILGSESERAFTAVTTDHIWQGVGLSGENRRVGAILVLELRVDRDTIERNVAVVNGRSRITLRPRQIHVARDKPLTDALRISKVCCLSNTPACDGVSINSFALIGC